MCSERFFMVVEYLEKLYQDLYKQKLNLERDNQKWEISLEDNNKFIQTLEKTLDENYESFSPRKVDEEIHIKIDNLSREQKDLEESIRKNKVGIIDLNSKLSELENIIKIARDNEKEVLLGYKKSQELPLQNVNIFEIQEIERQRIARDMHDSVVQGLTHLVHKIELCDKIGEIDPIRCKLELRSMTKNVREIIQSIREIIFDLRPMSLEDIGLEETMEREISKIRNFGILNVSYEIEKRSVNLPSTVSLAIFRVIQEICNNVLKHAKAKNLIIKMNYTEENIEIYVEDDGIGFDIKKVSQLEKVDNSGVGISMMRERVYLLGGKLDIDSTPGKGTRVMIKVPIAKEEN